MVDVLLVRPSYIVTGGRQNKLFEKYIELARIYMKDKLGFEGTEGLHIPVGLAYIAAKMEQDGMTVKVLDLHLLRYLYGRVRSIDDGIKLIKDIVIRERPKVVGIECMYSRSTDETIKLAGAVKDIDDIPIILGGTQATFFDSDLIKIKSIDYIVRGEGEKIFSELAKNIINGGTKIISGVTTKGGRDIITMGDALRINSLDHLPYPARHLFPMKDLYKINNHTDFLISSRGCKHNCAFCINKSFWKQEVSFRSVENVMGEIDEMTQKYNTKHICFYDETFGFNPNIVKDLCWRIRNEYPNIDWAIETRLDMFEKKTFKMLADSNCKLIYFGFESFSDPTLLCSAKNNTSEQSYQTLNSAKESGIESIMGTFIVGLPGDTIESFKETVAATEKLVKNGVIDICYFLPLVPFPGTDIFHKPHKYGIKIHTKDFNKYYYILDNPITLETKTMTRGDIKTLHDFALQRMLAVLQEKMKKEGFSV